MNQKPAQKGGSLLKKLLGSKKWTAVLVCFCVLLLATLVIMVCRNFVNTNTNLDLPMILEGEYKIDDGDWQPIDLNKDITDRFHKITFKGHLIDEVMFNQSLTFSTKNVWFTFKGADNFVVGEYQPTDIEKEYRDYLAFEDEYGEGHEFPDIDSYINAYYSDRKLAVHMPDTPGYYVQSAYMSFSGFEDPLFKQEYTLEVVYPYDTSRASFNDCFDVTLCESTARYMTFFYDVLSPVLVFVLVCFFGLFFFPIASFILGKRDYKYLIFGALLFAWGLFMILQQLSGYLNMWIADPTLCMMLHRLTNYLFIATILFYLKSNLENPTMRAVANVIATLYILLIFTVTILHLTTVADLNETFPNMFICTGVGAIAMAVLLLIETRDNKRISFVLGAWIPLAVTVIIDAVNHYLNFADFDFYSVGLTITMIYQFIQLVLDLKNQYKEAIRYQQMQKELYEAKVSVMVSQIQPHFMYNALSSIAMLCKINPDTAYQATITFSDYLRGNMDSLKQTAPVPFSKELEHLKKYLYIEELRFGKKLNIEYDITTTDFVLPLLSIQPLVENAVKHGVGMKKKGGTVTIATRETDDAYEVIISDDGVGFDTEAPKKDDGRSHVGMENTRRRIKEMCGGEVIITSTVGEGTVATVILPKEEQHHEDTVR